MPPLCSIKIYVGLHPTHATMQCALHAMRPVPRACNAPCAQVILSIAAGLVAFSSIVLGKALNLAYSAKLYAIAFLIVTFGAGETMSTGGGLCSPLSDSHSPFAASAQLMRRPPTRACSCWWVVCRC
jgi:hypothetical protein